MTFLNEKNFIFELAFFESKHDLSLNIRTTYDAKRVSNFICLENHLALYDEFIK